jgi:hypothetical protein
MEPDQSATRGPATDSAWRIFDPRYSLRARAVLIFGAGAVAFTLLLHWSAGTLFQRQLERTLGPSFENLAYQVGDKLDRSVYERTRALQFAATLAPFRTAGTPANQLRPMLDALLDASPDCAWVGFADANGTIVSAAPNLFENTDARASAWFRGARNQPYIGNPHEFPELARESLGGGDPNPRFLDVALPVTDSNGRFIGVLAAHLRWSWARDTLSSVVPETARREHLGVTIYAGPGEVLLDSGATTWTEPPPAPRVGNQPGLRGSLTEIVQGDATYLTGFARSRGYRTFRGSGWLVTVRQPATDAFAPVEELRRQIRRVGAALSLAVIVLTWIFTSYLTRRTKAIATAAGRIGSGDVLSLLPLAHGRDEFQTMCTALGSMVARLRQREEGLEADNASLADRIRAQNRTPKA